MSGDRQKVMKEVWGEGVGVDKRVEEGAENRMRDSGRRVKEEDLTRHGHGDDLVRAGQADGESALQAGA